MVGYPIRIGKAVKLTAMFGSGGWTVAELKSAFPRETSGLKTKEEILLAIIEKRPDVLVDDVEVQKLVGEEDEFKSAIRESERQQKEEIQKRIRKEAEEIEQALKESLKEENQKAQERKQIVLETKNEEVVGGQPKKRPRDEERKQKGRSTQEWEGLLYRGVPIPPEGKIEDAETIRDKKETPLWFSQTKETAALYAPQASGVVPKHVLEVWSTLKPLSLLIMTPQNIRSLVQAANDLDPQLGIVPDPEDLYNRLHTAIHQFWKLTIPKQGVGRINFLLDHFHDLVARTPVPERRVIFEGESWKLLFPTLAASNSYTISNLILEEQYQWFSLPQLIVRAFGTVGRRVSIKIVDSAITMWLCTLEYDGFIAEMMPTRQAGDAANVERYFHEEIVICGKARSKVNKSGKIQPSWIAA